MSAAGGDGGQPGGGEEYPELSGGQFDWQHSPHVRCYGEQGDNFVAYAIEYFLEIFSHSRSCMFSFTFILIYS